MPLNLHEETRATVTEIIIVFCAAIALMVTFSVILDYSIEKSEIFERAGLDAHLTPAQRAEIIGGGK